MKATAGLMEAIRASNAIEGVYDLRSFAEALKAFDWLMSFAIQDIGHQTILDCHKLLMKNQPLESRYKGKYRDIPVWIGGRKLNNHGLIAAEMDHWLHYSLHQDSSINAHIEFEKIHPFVDGNGRIGRLLMFYMQIKCEKGLHDVPSDKDRASYYAWFKAPDPSPDHTAAERSQLHEFLDREAPHIDQP